MKPKQAAHFTLFFCKTRDSMTVTSQQTTSFEDVYATLRQDLVDQVKQLNFPAEACAYVEKVRL